MEAFENLSPLGLQAVA